MRQLYFGYWISDGRLILGLLYIVSFVILTQEIKPLNLC